MDKIKDKIYKFLDRNYPIDRKQDNLIDTRFDEEIENIVSKVFGVSNIEFSVWVTERCGNFYGIKNHRQSQWFNKDHLLHRRKQRPAIISHEGYNPEYFENGWRVNPPETKPKYHNNRLVRPKYF